MASVARTGQLRRTRNSVPVPVEDPVTLVVRDIQKNILDMQKQYECPICLELITEPRATDCGHYFCKECILQYINLTSKKPPIKCPLCKETVTKRSLVECSSMGDISRAIRQLAEGYHLDTGTTISTPYVRNIVNSKTNENTAMTSSTPKKKTQIGTKQEDKIETLECDKSEVKANNNETETETNKVPGANSEQLDTSLENIIKGSAMRSRSLNGTNFPGFGDSKSAKVGKNKKKDFSKIIGDILGISDTFGSDQSNASPASFRCGNSNLQDGIDHNIELKTGTNLIDMKTPAFVNAKGFEFASSKSLLENIQNNTNLFDNPKLSNFELSEYEYRSKRLKSGTETNSMVSFVPGTCQLGTTHDRTNMEQTGTNTWFSNDNSLLSVASDIHSATTESLSGLTDFSPIKYPNDHNFNQNYDISPKLELTSRQMGTNFSSTLLASTKTEEYMYEGNILEMTFSDNSQFHQGNSQKESGTGTGTNNPGTETNYEEEITLTQFLTQRSFTAGNKESFILSQVPEMELEETSSHSNNATFIKEVSVLEPSYLGVNTLRFHDEPSIEPFSIEMSKDLVSVNQTKFEMELKELISETETLDSVIFTQPYITEYSLPNQIAPEYTETSYTLTDIFSPFQQITSSPKLSRSHSQSPNLSTNEIGIGKHTLLNLANESLENFNTQPETPLLSQNKEELLCAPMVAMAVINSQPEKDESLNFSRISQLIQTGNNTILGSNSFSHRVSDSYMEDAPFMEVRN